MRRRILTVALAAVVALIGWVAAQSYIHAAVNAGLAGQHPVTVIAAAKTLPAGTMAGQPGMFKQIRYPAGAVPAGYVRSVTPELARLVTTTPLVAGQILTRPLLARRGRDESALSVPRGMMALTLQFCLAQAVAGYLHAGSHVTVFAGPGGGQGCGNQPRAPARARMVLPSLRILATGPARGHSQPAAATGPDSVILLTVAVTPDEALALIGLADPYLALTSASVPVSATSKTGS